ncbi:MAG TPA: glycosyltransferase family 4 protein [Candidatus Sumerlaeota bacterium]|nr:glycosyltransferase family 4 protein [Candidatus Sumerlaeota bacterium]
MKRVLYISTSQGDCGGGEYYLALLAQAGVLEGLFQPEVLMDSRPGMDHWAGILGRVGVNVHRVPIRNLFDYRTRSLGCLLDPRNKGLYRDWIEKLSPDLVHVNQQNLEDGLDVVSAACAIFPGRIIGTIHNAQPIRAIVTHGRRVRDWWANRFHERTAYHRIFVSHASRRCFEQTVPLYDGWNHVVWNGVSEVFLENDPDVKSHAREAFGLGEATRVVGFAGRLTHQKNVALAISAFSKVAGNSAGESVFLVAGDGEERTELQAMTARMGIEGRVRWLGYLRDEDLETFYRALDLMVLPSRWEGFPLVLIEAQLRGIPVLASSVDGNVEALDFGRSGFLISPDDESAWVRALETFLSNPTLCREYGARGQAFARRALTSAVMAHNTNAVYEKVLSDARSAGS